MAETTGSDQPVLFLLLIAQLTAASPSLDFDLAKLRPVIAPCDSGTKPIGGEIIVCAKRRAATDIPIRALPEAPMLPRAEFKLFGNVRGKVSGERGNVGPIPTNRAMVTMSVPF
jgi:hypothetical protein